MSIGRTILAHLVAVSLAMLPIGSGAMVHATSSDASPDMSAMPAMDVATTAVADGIPMFDDMSDCCPGHDHAADKSMNDCGCMAACALKCFGFSAASASVFAAPSIVANLAPALVRNPRPSQTGSPPFRPPRV